MPPSPSAHPPNQERLFMQAGLALLLQAHEFALASGSDVWDFAVEIDQLRAAGLTNAALRWLITQGQVEHRREVTGKDAHRRRFRAARGLVLGVASCFVLTEQGGRLAAADRPAPEEGEAAGNGVPKSAVVPHWDAERRQLLYDGVVVKEFHHPAGNQELILAVFEEEGWPPRIDDPLPPVHEIDQQTRVRDAIRRLNRGQRHARLRFRADGRGIIWVPRQTRYRPRSAHGAPTKRPRSAHGAPIDLKCGRVTIIFRWTGGRFPHER